MRLGLILEQWILLDLISLCIVLREVVKISKARVIEIYSVPVALIVPRTFCFRSRFRISFLAVQLHSAQQYTVLTVFAKKVQPHCGQTRGICKVLFPIR